VQVAPTAGASRYHGVPYLSAVLKTETRVSTFTVRQGRRYRATIRLGWLEQLADNETIAGKLRAAGFTDVTVSGSGAKRHATALWSLNDASAPLPSQITSVVEVA
jgi:hypothetical protein